MESAPGPKAAWESTGDPSTGRYTVLGDRAIIFTGFPRTKTIDLPPLKLTDIETPFLSLILLSDDGKPLKQSNKLLLAIVGRGGNKDMTWDARRKSISDQWGNAPPQIEVIKARFKLDGLKNLRLIPLTAAGQPTEAIAKPDPAGFILGNTPTLWYELSEK